MPGPNNTFKIQPGVTYLPKNNADDPNFSGVPLPEVVITGKAHPVMSAIFGGKKHSYEDVTPVYTVELENQIRKQLFDQTKNTFDRYNDYYVDLINNSQAVKNNPKLAIEKINFTDDEIKDLIDDYYYTNITDNKYRKFPFIRFRADEDVDGVTVHIPFNFYNKKGINKFIPKASSTILSNSCYDYIKRYIDDYTTKQRYDDYMRWVASHEWSHFLRNNLKQLYKLYHSCKYDNILSEYGLNPKENIDKTFMIDFNSNDSGKFDRYFRKNYVDEILSEIDAYRAASNGAIYYNQYQDTETFRKFPQIGELFGEFAGGVYSSYLSDIDNNLQKRMTNLSEEEFNTACQRLQEGIRQLVIYGLACGGKFSRSYKKIKKIEYNG